MYTDVWALLNELLIDHVSNAHMLTESHICVYMFVCVCIAFRESAVSKCTNTYMLTQHCYVFTSGFSIEKFVEIFKMKRQLDFVIFMLIYTYRYIHIHICMSGINGNVTTVAF